MNTSTSPIVDEPKALLQSFEWVPKQDQINSGRYTMLANIRDLASGAALVMAIVERQQLDKERGDAPIVDSADALRLMRMSIAAMNVVEGYIDDHFDEMQHTAAARRGSAHKRGAA